MKKALFISLLFSASVFAIEPKHFYQYLPITPFFPPERPSRDYLQLDGPYAPWKATAPVPVWTEVALYRERVDEMRKLSDQELPRQEPDKSPDGFPRVPSPDNIVITVPVLEMGKPGQTKEDFTILDNEWFYIPKTTSSKPTSQATPGSSSEFNKTPIPVATDPNQAGGTAGTAGNLPQPPPSSKSEYNQPDERVK
jgi:hypothetical protein